MSSVALYKGKEVWKYIRINKAEINKWINIIKQKVSLVWSLFECLELVSFSLLTAKHLHFLKLLKRSALSRAFTWCRARITPGIPSVFVPYSLTPFRFCSLALLLTTKGSQCIPKTCFVLGQTLYSVDMVDMFWYILTCTRCIPLKDGPISEIQDKIHCSERYTTRLLYEFTKTLHWFCPVISIQLH